MSYFQMTDAEQRREVEARMMQAGVIDLDDPVFRPVSWPPRRCWLATDREQATLRSAS